MRVNLINARKNKGLSKKEVAEQVGITARMYDYLESGESDGSIPVWQKISLILDDSIDNLIKKEEREEK